MLDVVEYKHAFGLIFILLYLHLLTNLLLYYYLHFNSFILLFSINIFNYFCYHSFIVEFGECILGLKQVWSTFALHLS